MEIDIIEFVCLEAFQLLSKFFVLDYWKRRKAPHVKPLPIVGSTLDMLKKIEFERYRRLGPIYGYFEGNRPILSVGEPKHLEDILAWGTKEFSNRRFPGNVSLVIFSDFCKKLRLEAKKLNPKELITGDKVIDNMVSVKRGADSKRLRNIMIGCFKRNRLKEMVETVFKGCVETLIGHFNMLSADKSSIELKKIYGDLTMDVIATAAFSLKREDYTNPYNRLTKFADSVLNKKLKLKLIFFHLLPHWVLKILRINISSTDDTQELKRISLKLFEERRRTGERKNDFLQLLMDVKEKGDANATSDKHLSMDELVSQCAVFFLAGYDTTASTLSFATYLLALNHGIQETLRVEVDTYMDTNDNQLPHEEIQKMVYLDKVISETLRLYPPAFRLERQADAEYKLKNTGITIPKGMVITVPVFALHRDPKYWPNPETFDPERFTSERKKNRHPYCYLPFGSGPRTCIGRHFALMEVKYCLAYVIRHFKINTCSDTMEPLEFDLSQHGLLQPKDIKVSLEPRDLGSFHQ